MMQLGRLAGLVLMAATMASPAFAQDPAAANGTPVPVSDRIKSLAEGCFECHGPGGVSLIPTRPNIGGQNAAYLALQLMRFRKAAEDQAVGADSAGTGRSDPIMTHMASQVDYVDISTLSVYLSRLSCRPQQAEAGGAPTATPPQRQVPAVAARCATCHGDNGISAKPSIPNLAGQQRAYLRRELLMLREMGWGKDSADGWRNHPIMERQTARLKILEVDALADYYASLSCDGKN